MGYQGGFNNWSGNGYGNPFQFVPPPPPGMFSYTPFVPFRPDVVSINGAPNPAKQPNKKKTGFFQGFAQAAQSAFHTLGTAKGLAIMGTLYGAKLLFGPAFAALLLMGATGDGLFKLAKGLNHHDAEASGKGFFNMLVPALLLIVGGRFGFSLPAASTRLLGKTYKLATQEGENITLWHRIKAVFGRCNYVGPDGKELNAYALHRIRLQDWRVRFQNWLGRLKPAATN